MNIKDIEQHLNKIYVSPDVYNKLCEEGNIDNSVFLFGACVNGVDVIVKDCLPPNSCVHLNEDFIEECWNILKYDSERVAALMDTLLEEIHND